jgi:hypothetical protein
MWSRHFLAVGLASAAAIAVASSTLMWLIFAGFAGSGHFKLESITIPATVGLIGYPSSWYFVVYRAGDWSGGRIIVLVMLTFTERESVIRTARCFVTLERVLGRQPCMVTRRRTV